jgi:hypothetical protein
MTAAIDSLILLINILVLNKSKNYFKRVLHYC